MKKIVRLTENDLARIVKLVINENDRVYGGDKIKDLYNNLKDDEYVSLDDASGDLSGSIVSKVEYVKKMLRNAIREENWNKVQNAILFMDSKM
jgi:2-hydroxy-3-keto-5-methylthiopentenyl-1-phosphate phosphatase